MAMREPKPPTFRDIALLSDRIAREKRAGKKPMRKKPSPSAGKMMGAAKSMKVDPTDYMGRKPKPKRIGKAAIPKPAKRPKPMPKSSDIGERITKPYKKRVTSGSTSARIRNMEKKYRRKLMEK